MLKKFLITVICATACLAAVAQAADISVNINGTESIKSTAQGFYDGLQYGENKISVTYSEKMKSEEDTVSTVAALYCDGVLADVKIENSTPIGIGGEIPHCDFTLTIPKESKDFFVKFFFFEDFSRVLPLENKGKETSGTALAGNSIMVDGAEIPVNTEKQNFSTPEWIHIEDNNGYVFLEKGNVSVSREHNNGTSFAVITQEHGKKPQNAGYSYVILPKATPQETASYSLNPDVEIVCADENVHALRDLLTDTYYVNVYEGSYTINGVTLPECSAIIKENAGGIEITLSDPTQKKDSLEIKLSGKTVSAVTGADKDYVTINGSDALVDICARRGASYSFILTAE